MAGNKKVNSIFQHKREIYSVYTERLKNSENYFLSCGALSALGIQLQSGAILFI